MAAFETQPTFFDSVGMIDCAADLNILRRNVGRVDRWSYRIEPAFDSSAGVDTGTPLFYAGGNPMRIWWGAARFVAGCTTLTVEGYGKQSSAENVKVYINGTDVSGSGTLAMTITLPAGSPAAFSGTWTVSGLTDGDIVPVEVRIEGAHATNASYIITDIYFSTVAKSGWAAAPTFTASTINATKLNGLVFSTEWLYSRMRLNPMLPHLGLFYNLGPFKTGDPQHVDRPMLFFTIPRYYSGAKLRIAGMVTSLTTPGWFYYVQINGSTVFTSSTYGVGNTYIDQEIDLAGYTLGTRPRVGIFATVTNAGTAVPLRFTFWTLGIIHAVVDDWPYATLPAAFEPYPTLTTASDLVTRLNALSTIVNDTKARIDARPELWGRSRAMRRYMNRDDSHNIYEARTRLMFPWRVGAELYVKGESAELQWGVLDPGKINPNTQGYEDYSFSQKQQVQNSADGALLYLDDFPGLDVGSAYICAGNPTFLAEYIS